MNDQPKFPGTPTVINGNGAVAHVMQHVCGGVIGYPITPSTEIAELYEAARAAGGINVWGKHPFFFEPEGEHSAQSGALGAALTGGQFISNASSSQGILYALESHFVTVGKKVGGFVLQCAARVVSKHSLNVMAGHDDVYALLPSGYTILFGANPQEAADLAAISYRASSLSLIPVCNAMDGFATSHMMSECLLPEPELLRTYLGDPAGRIPCPTVAQEMLFGAKGRVAQLNTWLEANRDAFTSENLAGLRVWLDENADAIEPDYDGKLLADTAGWVPESLQGQWRRQWKGAFERGTRQLVPSLVDPHNPGMTGPVQNQPDFQSGSVDHRTHFASAVPSLVRQAMAEYGELTGRQYAPIMTYDCDDADVVVVALGSVTDDARAVLPHLRAQGIKAGVVSIKLFSPFPEAEVAEALAGKKAVLVLERSDQMALTPLVTTSLFKSLGNEGRYAGLPTLTELPQVSSAIFGLGGHDLQPRHLIAAFKRLNEGNMPPLLYLGSQFFDPNADPELAALQDRMREAYPETADMAIDVEPNPTGLLPESAMRIRFHSVGGYGTVATGKLLTDILAGVLDMHSKSAPKYGSEKSGAATNYYITLSPEPILITNAELEDVEVVISPDHRVFAHANPLKGLVEGGTMILQSSLSPQEAWRHLPASAREQIRAKKIKLFIVDAFAVAKQHAPDPGLETRMMGIAFIGAVATQVDRVASGATREEIIAKVRQQIEERFGGKGSGIVESNMAVVTDGANATQLVPYDEPEYLEIDARPLPAPAHTVALSAQVAGCGTTCASATGLFDYSYYETITAKPFREGRIGEAPVMPGAGMFVPPVTAAGKDKGLFRRSVPIFKPELCTGCLECALICPDGAIPNTVFELDDLLRTAIRTADLADNEQAALNSAVPKLSEAVRQRYLADSKDTTAFHELVAQAAPDAVAEKGMDGAVAKLVATLAAFPVARTRPFFDAMEKGEAGSGGLFSVTIDPWKCTGCLECIDICGPSALVETEQDDEVAQGLSERFAFLAEAPATPKRFYNDATDPGGDLKRMLLDRDNYYAITGGHGACRGCGEVTAIRLMMAASNAKGMKRHEQQQAELEQLITDLVAKKQTLTSADSERAARIDTTIGELEMALYLLEGGPTGKGPSASVIANATGCSSVYASTMPFNPYNDPWVNSLFQDAPALSKGLFEGLAAQIVPTIRAIRRAKAEVADAYDASIEDADQYLRWQTFTSEELAYLPTMFSIGGDGATYDIGFGALSRILASGSPVKAMILNTGSYSNTGGQASTASYTAQDSDLARTGKAHTGKVESRKELGLISAFHPDVFVVQTATSMQMHFLRNAVDVVDYTDGPAVIDIYTPCQTEQGIGDAESFNRGELAVRSRMWPVFVHDPRRGENVFDRFDIDGNPDPTKTWSTQELQYVNDDGQLALLTVPVTPADFAVAETRFAKQFRPLREDEETAGLPIDEFVELPADQRAAHVPFIQVTDADLRLVKVVCSDEIVRLVEERRRNWHLLQALSGLTMEQANSDHMAALAELREQFEEATTARESSIDEIARALTELAARGSGGAPVALSMFGAAPAAPAAAEPAADEAAGDKPFAELLEEDMPLCNDCKTCYQEMPELFESITIIEDGAPRKVARMIPGAVEKIDPTPENQARLRKIIDNCDAEIIR
jgi:pyruvate-ferredoxin/flavodoxin oxidoreductase